MNRTMKRLAIVIGAAGVLGLTAACEYDHRGYGYGGGDVAVGYDGYYDGFYGPFNDGYWGRDGGFYYRDGEGHPYHRDTGGHFRHEAGAGFNPVHGHGPTGGHAAEGGDHDHH